MTIRTLHFVFKNDIFNVQSPQIIDITKKIECTSNSSMVHFFIVDSSPYIT